MCKILEIWERDKLGKRCDDYKQEYPDAYVNKFSLYTDTGYELRRVTELLRGVPERLDFTRPLHVRWARIAYIHKQAWMMRHSDHPVGKVNPGKRQGLEIKYKHSKEFGFDQTTQVA